MPYNKLKPYLENHAKNPKFKIVKVNVDEHQYIAEKMGIVSVPTIILVKSGKIVDKIEGCDFDLLDKMIKQV